MARNTGARIHGLDVNQGNQLNGAHVCSCSTNSVSPFTGITWIDLRGRRGGRPPGAR